MTLWVWGHSYLPTRSSAPLDPRKYLPGEGPSARPSSRLHCQHSGQGSGRICGVFDSCHTQVWAARVGVAGPRVLPVESLLLVPPVSGLAGRPV